MDTKQLQTLQGVHAALQMYMYGHYCSLGVQEYELDSKAACKKTLFYMQNM